MLRIMKLMVLRIKNGRGSRGPVSGPDSPGAGRHPGCSPKRPNIPAQVKYAHGLHGFAFFAHIGDSDRRAPDRADNQPVRRQPIHGDMIIGGVDLIGLSRSQCEYDPWGGANGVIVARRKNRGCSRGTCRL